MVYSKITESFKIIIPENSVELSRQDCVNKHSSSYKTRVRPRKQRHSRYYPTIVILSLLLSLLHNCVLANISKNVNLAKMPLSPSSSSGSTSILEIYENESYDSERSTWYGAENRWTSSTGSISDPPTSLQPPLRFIFASDWKIDVTGTGTRDKEGWEYFYGGIRRRRWLRTLAPIQEEKYLTESKGVDSVSPGKTKKLKEKGWIWASKKWTEKERSSAKTSSKIMPQFNPISFLVPLINDYNFKGFGLSLYKSLIFPTSYGALWRLPLSTNFDSCDTRPHIPSLTTSAGFFGTHDNFTLVTFLNLSLPMEVIRYALAKIVKFVYVINWFIWNKLILGTIRLLYSLMMLFYPLSSQKDKRQKPSKEKTVSSIMSSKSIQYSSDYMERITFSLSWRISNKKGYEFRISYSHIYLPTMDYLFLRNRNGRWSNWLRGKTSSLGISTGYPIPDYPPVSCSAVFSLSGFYPKLRFLGKSIKEQIDIDNSESTKEENDIQTGIIPLHETINDVMEDSESDDDFNISNTTQPIASTSSIPVQEEISIQKHSDDEKKKLISSSFGWDSNGE